MGMGEGRTQGSMHGVGVGLEVKVCFFCFFFMLYFFVVVVVLRMSLQSRTEDLTHNVRGLCPRLSIHVSSKIDLSFLISNPPPPPPHTHTHTCKDFTVLISKVYLIRVLSIFEDLRFNVRGEHVPGCMGIGRRRGDFVATSRGYMCLSRHFFK